MLVKPLELPETIYLVAPGRNSLDGIKLIPHDATILAVNKGVLIDLEYAERYWIVLDRFAIDAEWWDRAYKASSKRVFSNWVMHYLPEVLNLKLNELPPGKLQVHRLFRPNHPVEDGRLFPGGTVTAVALYLAYMAGVKTIYLCGVDMFGNSYFDGQEHPTRNLQGEYDARWLRAYILENRIDYLKSRGLAIKSLTETALNNVEIVQDVS